MTDADMRDQILYQQTYFRAPEGMGRYLILVYILPSTLMGLLYCWLKRQRRRRSPFLYIFAWQLASLPHMLQGRRLMWLGCEVMGVHIAARLKLFKVRAWHLLLITPVMIFVFSFYEATKNYGYADIGRITMTDIVDTPHLVRMYSNSIGRFEISAAVILNHKQGSYLYGMTFLQAPLQLIPSVARNARSNLTIEGEIGQQIYGDSGAANVSQAASAFAELFANFGSLGVLFGFSIIAYVATRLDIVLSMSDSAMGTLMYCLLLFRWPHQLVTESGVWLPMTAFAFLPLFLAYAVRAATVRSPMTAVRKHG
jgi:hypothetical protein